MTRYATEILERRRAAAAPGAFPFDGPFERLREGLEFKTRAHAVEDPDPFAVLALAARLVPLDPARARLCRIDDVVFRRPVRVGDEVHVEGRLEEVAAGGEESGEVTLGWNVVDQAGRCVCRARVELAWAREDSVVAIPL